MLLLYNWSCLSILDAFLINKKYIKKTPSGFHPLRRGHFKYYHALKLSCIVLSTESENLNVSPLLSTLIQPCKIWKNRAWNLHRETFSPKRFSESFPSIYNHLPHLQLVFLAANTSTLWELDPTNPDQVRSECHRNGQGILVLMVSYTYVDRLCLK